MSVDEVLKVLEHRVFKNFVKMDKKVKKDFDVSTIGDYYFNSEEKAKKFIEQTHMLRGDAIVLLIEELQKDLNNNITYEIIKNDKEIKLVKNRVLPVEHFLENAEVIKINNSNLEEVSEELENYIYKNWRGFPIDINIFDNDKNISLVVGSPKEFRKFNKLNLIDRVLNLHKILKEEEKNYVTLGEQSDNLWNIIVFSPLIRELKEKSFTVEELELFKSKLGKTSYIFYSETNRKLLSRNPNKADRKVYENFLLAIRKDLSEDNILSYIDYSFEIFQGIVVEKTELKKCSQILKEKIKNMPILERNNLCDKLEKINFIMVESDLSQTGFSKLDTFIKECRINASIKNKEKTFDSFIEEEEKHLYKKTLRCSYEFARWVFGGGLQKIDTPICQIVENVNEVTITLFTEFKIEISNKELLKKMKETFKTAVLERKASIYQKQDFNKHLEDMLRVISLEQKLETIEKENSNDRGKRKI